MKRHKASVLLSKRLFKGLCVAVLMATPLFAESKEAEAKRVAMENHLQYNLTIDEKLFETTLFAAPPMVEYVTAVSADLDGTVYVSVDPNGSLGHIEGVGKVMTAKDTDGDGKADAFKDFIPQVSSPRGGHYVAGTYYLLHPPFLSLHRDTDGDGVADENVTLIKGFGGGIEHPRGADHTTNGVRMGIDGWLYISVGDFGIFDAKDTDGNVVRLQGGGVARCRPDGRELEVYVYHTRNQYDVAISPILELFTRDNTNDGKGWNLRVHQQVPEADFGYPRLYQNFPDEHLASLADYGGGSGMGCLFLDEPGFPAELNQRLYTCDWTSGKLFGFNMTPDGETYKLEQTVLTNLERASDVDVDGRSNLYLADWKGGRFSFENGKPVSRIHMAKLKGYQAPEVPNLAKASEDILIEHVIGNSATTRLQAQQYLLQKSLSDLGVKKLERKVLDASLSINSKVAALFTLKQAMGEQSHAFCERLLENPSMREFALKALTDRKTQLAQVSPDLIATYLSDANPRVRLQAAISLKRLNKYSAKATQALMEMACAAWSEDSVVNLGTRPLPHMASRALASLGQHHDAVWKQFLVEFKKGDFKTQKTLAYGLKTIHNPELIQDLMTMFGHKEVSDESRLILLDILARLSHKEKEWDLVQWWGTRPMDEGPYFEAADWEWTQPIIQAIEKNFGQFMPQSQLKVLNLLALNQINPSLLKLEGVDMLFMAFEAHEPSGHDVQVLKAAAMDVKHPWNIRIKAGHKLFDFQEWEDATAVFNKKSKDSKEKQEEMIAKKKQKSRDKRKEAIKALLEVMAQWQVELINNTVVVESVAAVKGIIHDYWTAPIANADDLKSLPSLANTVSDGAATLAWKKLLFAFYRTTGERQLFVDKAIDGKEALHNAGYYKAIADLYLLEDKFKERATSVLNWDHKGVRDGAAEVLAMFEANDALKADAVKGQGLTVAGLDKAAEYALIQKGDVQLGAKIFNRQGCITCHAISSAGLQKGPYLGAAGSQFERKFIIESVLNPMAAIAQGFPTYLITPKPGRGQPYVGFLVNENNSYYYIMTMAGMHQTITKEHMEKKELLPTSQMPPGLVFTLNLHEFASLIEYLVSMK